MKRGEWTHAVERMGCVPARHGTEHESDRETDAGVLMQSAADGTRPGDQRAPESGVSRNVPLLRLLLACIGILLTAAPGCESPLFNRKPAAPAEPATALAPNHAPNSDAPEDRPTGFPLRTIEGGLQLVLIPPGEFLMGADASNAAGTASSCEQPRHTVRISRPFWIGRCEVTVGDFRRFVSATGFQTDGERLKTGSNGLDPQTGQVARRPEWVWSDPGFPQTDAHPVVCVSWRDAEACCQWLSQVTRSTCRLPTEAEWEYACRAGTDTVLSTGDGLESLEGAANCGEQSLSRAFPTLSGAAPWDDGTVYTAETGRFRANAFGLHDMHGNVGEWCHDWYAADYYNSSPSADPAGPLSPQPWRVVRGGSWYNAPFSCRSSGRHDCGPTEASTTNGFRIVMEAESEVTPE